MIVIKLASEMLHLANNSANNGATVGFVPTMGALHQGHLSLVEEAIKTCDTVIVSIYVNPTQFNNSEDLKNYPSDLIQDLDKLKQLNVNMVFVPKSFQEVYANEESLSFNFNNIDKIMEGGFREGHFDGVVRVVKFFLEKKTISN